MLSPIDKIFEEIFGYIPSKKGAAYERLAAIAAHFINGGDVKHDDRLRGEFSKTLYQIDVHQKTSVGSSMCEAKDYSDRNEKVGRGDLQKLGGALPDLTEINNGSFFSATGYTAPAKKYAKAASSITGGKPISLYELRPSTELDEQGTIKTIVINLHIQRPHPEQANWVPHLTEKGRNSLKAMLQEGEERRERQTNLVYFYDKNGNKILSLMELTSHGYGEINNETNRAKGCFLLKNKFININGILAEINGLEYDVPFSIHTRQIRITDDSEHRFVLSNEDGDILSFLRDSQLRTYGFDDSGNLIKR